MQPPGSLIKADKWWNDKAPPVLGLAFFLLAVGEAELPVWRAAVMFLAFMVSFIGVAGFGHVINDLCDVTHDRAAGKHNTMVGRPRTQVVGMLIVLLGAAWLPWFVLPANRWNLSLIGLQLLLLTVYAVPPLRFKARAVPGIVTDALYAYTVPALITWSTFAHIAGAPISRPLLLAALVAWSFLAGLRGILHHQYLDADNDRRSGVTTFATRYGARTTLRILSGVVLPIEAVCFAVLTMAFGRDVPFYVLAVAGFLVWRMFQLTYLWDAPLGFPWQLSRERVVTLYGYQFLGEFYAHWFPLFMLVALSWRWPEYLALTAVYLVVFQNGLVNFAKYDLKYIPAGIGKMMGRHG